MLLTDHLTSEGQFQDDDGAELYFADFIDGVDEALPFEATIPKTFEAYEPIYDDGVSHCFEVERAEMLDQFLDQIAGRYRIAVSAFKEVCVSGWWANVQAISFSDMTDRDLFTLRFGK